MSKGASVLPWPGRKDQGIGPNEGGSQKALSPALARGNRGPHPGFGASPDGGSIRPNKLGPRAQFNLVSRVGDPLSWRGSLCGNRGQGTPEERWGNLWPRGNPLTPKKALPGFSRKKWPLRPSGRGPRGKTPLSRTPPRGGKRGPKNRFPNVAASFSGPAIILPGAQTGFPEIWGPGKVPPFPQGVFAFYTGVEKTPWHFRKPCHNGRGFRASSHITFVYTQGREIFFGGAT